MKIKNYKKKLVLKFNLIIIFIVVLTNSCQKDLAVNPVDPRVLISSNVYTSVFAYKSVLAKIYAGLATTGQTGPAGNPDISDIDEGFSSYLRGYWQLQELTTDEAVIAWDDKTIKDLHFMKWTTNDVFIQAFYYRLYFQITIANEFIRECSDSKLASKNFSESDKNLIKTFKAEARFLRALSYWHALDLFGSVPFVSEIDPVSSFEPPQITKSNLFNYIENELIEIDANLAEPMKNEYGRVDKAVAWTLLTKIYLNANIYTGISKYNECINYCNKIINAGYKLQSNYSYLFLSDNNLTSKNEIIFPIVFDAARTQTYGGMTYLINASIGGAMVPTDYGVLNGWAGLRTTSNVVDKFGDLITNLDKRAMFFSAGQSKTIADVGDFKNGFAVIKFKNISSLGVTSTKDPNGTQVDTDFPMFRLGEIYLIYTEAVLRGGIGGSTTTALQYINALRDRAYQNANGATNGQITMTDLNLNFILDERVRELYWEGNRRTDLIRFEKFTTDNYLWPWKGNVYAGKSVESYRVLFPIPTSDITSNTKLKQNNGY